MNLNKVTLLAICLMAITVAGAQKYKTWTADNGNGTFTNPLWFEEFSDPTMVRVGSDFYLTGTTNHVMPGLPLLHSKDLVNWELITYVFDRLDLGPDFRLEDCKEIYGDGIWAPSLVYHEGKFYIFANINGYKTQMFTATDPKGPWTHSQMDINLHDLSVFFDDDGKRYVTWGAIDVRMAELNETLTDTIPGTSRIIARGVGEGAHMYKFDKTYMIIWAVPGATTPMLAGVSENVYGPYEVVTLSGQDHMSVSQGITLKNSPATTGKSFEFNEHNRSVGYTLHQGGVIDTPTGEWWGYSMQDHNSLGRVLNLAPVTWQDGFPYFGLPGNLTKTPRTWRKPDVGLPQQPISRYINTRYDDFDSGKLEAVWQWNHVPVDTKWSLNEKSGVLRLHSLAAENLWCAKNSLTQRVVGPRSTATVEVDFSGMQMGDVAGLAVLSYPYSWIGVEMTADGYRLKLMDLVYQNELVHEELPSLPLNTTKVYLRVNGDYDSEKVQYSYSLSGKKFTDLGGEVQLSYQMVTFQGARYTLFHYNRNGRDGGYVDFDNYTVYEPDTSGFLRPIPYGKRIELVNKADGRTVEFFGHSKFTVEDRRLGRVALHNKNGYLWVNSDGSLSIGRVPKNDNQLFQWIELERGDLALMSLVTNRFLTVSADDIKALTDVPSPTRTDGASFTW